MKNSVVFDIGATKTRIAFTENLEKFEEPLVYFTPASYDEGIQTMVAAVKKVANGRKIHQIAGGMTRNIAGWVYEKLTRDLNENLQIPAYLENDSAIVGLGEAVFGAGRGYEIVAYVTVSTGVGGAKIINGKIDENAYGFEPGKQIIDISENKTLEDLISGRALSKKTGKHPKEITDPAVWDEHARLLAVGLNNIIVEWSPNCVVLGGSMITGDPAIPIDKTEAYLKDILKIFGVIPVIKKAELQDFGGLWGAMAYLKGK